MELFVLVLSIDLAPMSTCCILGTRDPFIEMLDFHAFVRVWSDDFLMRDGVTSLGMPHQ